MRFLPLLLIAFFVAGFTYHYPKLPTKTITYSCGNAELAQAVREWAAVSDLSDGGCNSDPIISLVVIDPWPYPDRGGQVVFVNANKRRIEMRPEYEHRYPEILHEVGHALGLGHSLDEGAIMYWNPCNKTPGDPAPGTNCNTMNADDIAGVQSLYDDLAPATPTAIKAPPGLAHGTPVPTPAIPTEVATVIRQSTAAPTIAPERFRLVIPGVAAQ